MTFIECVALCAGNQELVQEFNRLTGLHMGEKRSGIDLAIDEACGHDPDKEAFPAFIEFVEECIWEPFLSQLI